VNWGYYPAMKVIDYYLDSWRRFRDFQGRTTRPAFWWPFLIHPIVFLVLGGIFAAILGLSTDQAGPEVVYAIAYVWVLITLGVRRLHDMGRKGTWLLLGLVPFGNLVLLYWLVQPSTSETNPPMPDYEDPPHPGRIPIIGPDEIDPGVM